MPLGSTNILDDLFPLDAGNKYSLKTHPQELGVDVRQELLDFHSKYYSSNLMTLVVIGKGTVSFKLVKVVTRTCALVQSHWMS